MPVMLFQNFMAASRKVNLARFRLFWNIQDTSWIDSGGQPPTTFLNLAYNANLVIDSAAANVITITLTGNVTSSSINYLGSTPPVGTQFYLRIIQDATGGHTFALPPNLDTDQGYAIDPGANRITMLPIQYTTSNRWEFFSAPFSYPA